MQDMEILFKRIEICLKYGFTPYIMRYYTVDLCKYRRIYQDISTWTNHPGMIITKATLAEFIEDGSFGTSDSKEFFFKNKIFEKYLNMKVIYF